jgi:hypothetical protein
LTPSAPLLANMSSSFAALQICLLTTPLIISRNRSSSSGVHFLGYIVSSRIGRERGLREEGNWPRYLVGGLWSMVQRLRWRKYHYLIVWWKWSFWEHRLISRNERG